MTPHHLAGIFIGLLNRHNVIIENVIAKVNVISRHLEGGPHDPACKF